MMYRQGDVLLRRTDRQLTKRHRRVPRDQGRIVLAYGEATGHAHAIAEPHVELFDLSGERMLQVDAPANLVHEEHDDIALPAGLYEVVQQREYDPDQGSRSVLD